MRIVGEVEVDLPARQPESVEVGRYYVVSGALANTASTPTHPSPM
jgi:hypothetical protein